MSKGGILRKKVVQKKEQKIEFNIDCSQPVEDGVFVPEDFETFLKQRIKVDGHKGQLGDSIAVKADGSKVNVTAKTALSKRYLKYLTKKYLKKNELRDYLHVVSKDKKGYQIRYFNIQAQEGDQE